jgi:hypothetical protein
LKGTHPGTIPARFGLIWFSGFRGEDLNVCKIVLVLNMSDKAFKPKLRTLSEKRTSILLFLHRKKKNTLLFL